MALLASLAIPSTPKVRIKLFQNQLCQLQRCSVNLLHKTVHTHTCSVKVSMADHNEPEEVKRQIRNMTEKIREAMPISVQEFPWSKAEHMLLDRLFFLAREAVKWSLVSFFILSSLSDIVYTVSMNHELIIPVGLFVGCLAADFLIEISQELFHSSKEKGLNRHLLGMYCFFVFVKFISTYFRIQEQVFLLHVANGGLMQVFWHWRSFMEGTENGQEGSSLSGLEA